MSFADFLAAKYPLDERSVNPSVRSAWMRGLQDMPVLDCLDVGAGTGATVRRMLEWRPSRPWCLTLLECNHDLIERARTDTLRLLTERGCRPAWRGDRLESEDGRFAASFVACGLESYRPQSRYDAIVAHAVMDLVPLAPALERFAQWLRPDGYLYAAINYDGQTELGPPYRDAAFESELAACYNASMEARKSNDESTGGARCGERLQALLPRHGFEIACAGRSDWHLRPIDGRYPDDDQACLAVLIGLIAKEAVESGRFDAGAVARWREDRLQHLEARQLELRARNCDVLARRPRDRFAG
ncbi:MAG: methyltransferase domain-containing protein [Betaproteobacteria bacterium]|nr:methyltransferase domain-containing protein [Betaproteobacteria bacterium]